MPAAPLERVRHSAKRWCRACGAGTRRMVLVPRPGIILVQYCGGAPPVPGDRWRANFYKCGDETSHPHWASWSPVGRLDFHRPQRLRNDPVRALKAEFPRMNHEPGRRPGWSRRETGIRPSARGPSPPRHRARRECSSPDGTTPPRPPSAASGPRLLGVYERRSRGPRDPRDRQADLSPSLTPSYTSRRCTPSATCPARRSRSTSWRRS